MTETNSATSMVAKVFCEFRSTQRNRQIEIAAILAHPRWTRQDDQQLWSARSSGDDFSAIAREMGRNINEVKQRWHRLRVIPQVHELLEKGTVFNE